MSNLDVNVTVLSVTAKMLNHPIIWAEDTPEFNKTIGFRLFWWIGTALGDKAYAQFKGPAAYLWFNPLTGESEVNNDPCKQLLIFMKVDHGLES